MIVGILRYPYLPAYLGRGGHRVATSPLSAFAVVVGQVYATGLWTALLVLVYRSRPDLDTADPAASLRSYRKALGVFARAGLVLLACVDLSLLLAALQLWQILRLSGSGNVSWCWCRSWPAWSPSSAPCCAAGSGTGAHRPGGDGDGSG